MLRTAFQFSVAGPLIGGALYLIPAILLEQGSHRAYTDQATTGINVLIWLLLSYAVGLVPAALTGAVLGAMRHQRRQASWAMRAAGIGLLTGGMVGGSIDIYNAVRLGTYIPITTVFLAIPSCISAWACAYFFRPLRFNS
ncbi:hypothetical protein KSF73_14110 [Burkholderiaceae bacterium DAT-1]|nr:hypothetical protein [Burkholderiaceae bacterium DAT-1]